MAKLFRKRRSKRSANPEPPTAATGGKRASGTGKFARLTVPLIAIIIGLTVHLSPIGTTTNSRILEWRMAATTLPPSGDVVFVAIDSRSLREVGTWPWSRSIHANILDQLVAAGAYDILFDIDFAFPSDAQGDAAFAGALDRAGGGTFLASFLQREHLGSDAGLAFNLPYRPFRDLSWPAVVNVISDQDSLIRRYMSGAWIEEEFVPSAAVLLAGGALDEDAQFEINYAISPNSINALSAVDVARGDFSAEDVAGRTVIVGAAAVELGDHFSVPLHQNIPGALLHALATETLLLDASVTRLRPEIVALALGMFVFVLNGVFRRRAWHLLGVTFMASCITEAVALVIFQTTFTSIPTAFVHPVMFSFVLMKLANLLGLTSFLLLRSDLHNENTHALLSHIFDHSSDGIVIIDAEGQTLMQSRSATSIFETDDHGAVLLPMDIKNDVCTTDPLSDSRMTCPIPLTVTLDKSCGAKNIEYLATQSVFHEPGKRQGKTIAKQITAISVRDVTDQKRREREIEFLSTHDARTGALRRELFLDRLGSRLLASGPTSVFVLNLHRFKAVNRTLGRDVGDAVLVEVVCRLQSFGRGLSAIARLDGDSFAFFIDQSSYDNDEPELAEDLIDHISEPYIVGPSRVRVGARIGYFIAKPSDRVTAQNALGNAEDAVDVARISGTSEICVYDLSVAKERERIRAIERAMFGAIHRNEMYVVYQPQHRLTDGALIGVEALVRWEIPTLGNISPEEFIPISETNGFISELGRFVLHQAARDALKFPDDVVMAVNVSSIQFNQTDLQKEVQDALEQSGLDPSRLCLELTESVLLTQEAATIETMRDIALTGVTWAMDDFGTGYSSMAYLSSLPIAKIKLDQSFTRQLGSDPTATAVLRSVVTLCHGLGIDLLCEGIETSQHVEILLQEGCLEGQGYYYGKPQSYVGVLKATEHHLVGGRH